MSKSDALKSIQEFLIQENRPFSVNEISEKCGKQFTKSIVQKTLDSLVTKGVILEKTYGKQKIYFIKQTTNIIEIKKKLQSSTQKLTQTQNILKTKQAEYLDLKAKLESASKVRSLESLEEERDKLLEDIRLKNEKFRRCEASEATSQITPAAAKKIENHYENIASSYRKRKRMCNDMLDAILEGYPKSKRQLIDDIGVETDESVGFNLNVKR